MEQQSCPECGSNEFEEMVPEKDIEGLQAGRAYGVCHKCKRIFNRTEVYSRIVGYLRPVSQWNPGKQSEWSKRKTYKIEGKT